MKPRKQIKTPTSFYSALWKRCYYGYWTEATRITGLDMDKALWLPLAHEIEQQLRNMYLVGFDQWR